MHISTTTASEPDACSGRPLAPLPNVSGAPPIDGSYIIFSAYCPIITHCCLVPVRRYRALRLVAPGAVPASSAVATQSIQYIWMSPIAPLTPLSPTLVTSHSSND